MYTEIIFRFYSDNKRTSFSKFKIATNALSIQLFDFLHCNNIRRIYCRIAGTQLPGHVPLFLREPVKIILHGRTGKTKVVLRRAVKRY